MTAKLIQLEVGPWPMNSYIIVCEISMRSAVVDPGADAKMLQSKLEGTRVDKIILTHTHEDHIGALEEIKRLTASPVMLNPLEYETPTQSPINQVDYDIPISHEDRIQIGEISVQALHTPGHTPGMTSFDLGDGRILVGDTLFVGGPGKTWSPGEFEKTMKTMKEVVFRWPADTEFYPGHGPSGVIGAEIEAFQSFINRGWDSDFHGDVTWK